MSYMVFQSVCDEHSYLLEHTVRENYGTILCYKFSKTKKVQELEESVYSTPYIIHKQLQESEISES